jgi:solute carrier family 25 protein 39/40
MVNTKGITILWRGLGPTLWRDVPFSGEYGAGDGDGWRLRASLPILPILDCIDFYLGHNSVSKSHAPCRADQSTGLYWAGFEIIKSRLSSTSSPLPQMSPITTSFLSGAISGTLSALLTQPFDVLKTRRQVFTPSSSCSPQALKHRASTIPLAMHVIKTEGTGALFAGTIPRCAKVAPACGLMIACYEGVGRWLGGEGEQV